MYSPERRREYQKEYYHAHTEKLQVRAKEAHRNLRRRVIEMFGGKCVYCGFSDSRALQIDHKDGCGHAERKATSKASYRWYQDLLSNPQDSKTKYQLLCANCNFIKRHTHNEVPGPKSRC